MESSGRKSELMKPILLKAAIPLAFSLAGFIYSKITTRRNLHFKRLSRENNEGVIGTDSQGLLSTSQQQMEDMQNIDPPLPIEEDEILGLKNRVSILIGKEQEHESRFLRYCELKEREIALMEFRNLLALELTRAELWGMRVESMEAENHRFESLVVEYVAVVNQLGSAEVENELLHKKVKKLSKMRRESFRVFSRQKLILRARESEISRCHEELKGRKEVVRKLENEIMEMKTSMDKLLGEKEELVERLELGESSAASASKKKVEETVVGEQDQLLAELEQFRKAQAIENEELIHLRWINACLRHELTRIEEQQIQHDQEDNAEPQAGEDENGDHTLGYCSDDSTLKMEHGETCAGGHKKPKLLHKLRKWVKRSDGCRRSCDEKEYKYNPMHSISGARKSCS